MEAAQGPEAKKAKMEEVHQPTCHHYVKRKKRFCKMTVSKGKNYCGEHDVSTGKEDPLDGQQDGKRIPCPLDQTHTVYRYRLKKHLEICNARPKDLPAFVVPGINKGEEVEDHSVVDTVKLSELDFDVLNTVIEKVENIYRTLIEGQIEEKFKQHDVLESELSNPEYGHETRKHLVQTSSILGFLRDENLLQDNTSFIEFGAGKGQVSYWVARAISKFTNSNVLLIDRASHRHKKDNKLEDRNSVHRIRADIADFEMRKLPLLRSTKRVVGVGKHLCGAATDLTLRCITQAQNKLSNDSEELESIRTEGFIIALCCHHRCDWRSFVGKSFFKENGLDSTDFEIIRRMVSWAVCGSGQSREVRKKLEHRDMENDFVNDDEQPGQVIRNDNFTRKRREEVGYMCKRVLDYSKLKFMSDNGFTCSLNYYVEDNITLENVCMIGINNKKDL